MLFAHLSMFPRFRVRKKLSILHKLSYAYCAAWLTAGCYVAGMNDDNVVDVQTGFRFHLIAMNDDTLELKK
jgi:hypothetical protein